MLKLNKLGETDLVISHLGFGGSAIGGVHKETNDVSSQLVVKKAIERGINYIDTAPWYGHGRAESVLGDALLGIPRNSYYVATKVGRYKPNVKEMFDFTAERTVQSVSESLQRLHLDYVDVIQVHDLEFAPNVDIIVDETLPALQRLKNAGKVKYVGITGYPLSLLREVVERSQIKIDTVLSYCRNCLFDNTLQEYVSFFQERKIGIIDAAILGMGLLTNSGPASWHPANEEIKKTCAEAALYCKERNVDIARIALHYSLQLPGVATHLVSVSDMDLLNQNLDVALNGITEYEQQIMQDVRERYFSKLTMNHWENVDVIKYWEQMKSAA